MRRIFVDEMGVRAIVSNDWGYISVKGRFGTRIVDGHRDQHRVIAWLNAHHFHQVYNINFALGT